MKRIPNTFGIEARAMHYLEYASEEELKELIASGKIVPPYLHVGTGSNLLFTADYPGTILHSRITGITVIAEDEQTVTLRVGAGITWDDFVLHCVKLGWYGAENLSLIPGEVGAAAVQNIGAYGVEAKDLIVAVETVNIHGQQRTYATGECRYAYRESLFKQPEMKSLFVTRVHFRLSKQPCYKLDYGTIRQELERFAEVNLKNVREAIIRIRESKLPDPKVTGNAGSFFMNPIVPRRQLERLQERYPSMPYYEVDADRVKIPAGWMIDRCGWKGKALGRAAVHDKQALVLVNRGGATAADIIALSDAIRASVKAEFGIAIYPEVNFI